jgi:hypothetical protein
MFGFATAVTDEAVYETVARRGIARVAEPDSVVLTRRGLRLSDAYNELLEEAAGIQGLEALVMMHQDTELRDSAFAAKVRARLADPEVAMVGALGVRGVRAGAVWMPRHVGYGRITEELFGLERVLATGNTTGAHEVDALDGFLLVLSPWAVRNLRFDPAFDEVFHSYDLDFSFQARAHGKKLVVEQIDVIHRRGPRIIDDSLKRAATIWRRKWSWDGAAGGPRIVQTPSAGSSGSTPAAAKVNDSQATRPAAVKNRDDLLIEADRRRADALQDELIGEGRRVLDLDTLDLARPLGEARFDVVLARGVLGRLRRPDTVLARILPHIDEGGYLLVRLANAAHTYLRMSAYGSQIAREAGPLEQRRAHFTRHNAVAMITSAGYCVGAVKSIEWDLGSELVHCDQDRLSTETLRLLVSEPDARAVEYLIVAYPAGRPAPPIVAELANRHGQKIRPLGIASRATTERGGTGAYSAGSAELPKNQASIA